jgi:single-strand selective monofunctional uracil DNA glycosylase
MAQHQIISIADKLSGELAGTSWSEPVSITYDPLVYAREPWAAYADKYAGEGQILLLGMNPGPWGMAQTGVPFGAVELVQDWMGITGIVYQPEELHPKRPITGFACKRAEVSGSRLWGWARKRFGDPEQFFARFFVINYCPLIFYTDEGKNVTPDKLKAADRRTLYELCNRSLVETVKALTPAMVLGVGRFALDRAEDALGDQGVPLGRITHPSPANPAANKGWEAVVERELKEMGIALPG